MVTAAVIFIALAAVGGITLAYLHLKNNDAPIALAVVHGLFAATGLVLLIITAAGGQSNWMIMTAIVIFVIAAIGGLTLFTFHLRSRPLPKALIFLHGGLAVTAFIFTLFGAYSAPDTEQ